MNRRRRDILLKPLFIWHLLLFFFFGANYSTDNTHKTMALAYCLWNSWRGYVHFLCYFCKEENTTVFRTFSKWKKPTSSKNISTTLRICSTAYTHVHIHWHTHTQTFKHWSQIFSQLMNNKDFENFWALCQKTCIPLSSTCLLVGIHVCL